jgi:hypothetical protein
MKFLKGSIQNEETNRPLYVFLVMVFTVSPFPGGQSFSTRNVDVALVSNATTAAGYTFTYNSRSTGTIYFYINITYKDDTQRAFKQVENVSVPGTAEFSILTEYATSTIPENMRSHRWGGMFPPVQRFPQIQAVYTAY